MQLPFSMRVPIPPQILEAVVLTGFLNGFVLDSRNAKYWLPMSISIWLGFECLLRPKEIAQLCFNDLRLPCDSILSYGFFSICRIRDPKNRRFFGRSQFALCKNTLLNNWLVWLASDVPKATKLFPGTQASLSRFFRRILAQLGLAHLRLSLGSLRAGRATQLFMHGLSPDTIRFMGRWASLATLEHYIQESSSMAVLLDIDPATSQNIAHLLTYGFILHTPPGAHWSHFFSRTQQFRKLGLGKHGEKSQRIAAPPGARSAHSSSSIRNSFWG